MDLFSKPFPPQNLKIGYLGVNVDVSTPNPLRCFQCQKFSHVKDACKNKFVARKITAMPVVKAKQNIAWVIICPFPKTVLSGKKTNSFSK